jgi:hypothetical protein
LRTAAERFAIADGTGLRPRPFDDGRTTPRTGSNSAVLVGMLLVAFIVLAWQIRAPGIYAGEDDAGYVLLGRALRGFSYRELQYVGEPIAARYPPGYPAVVAIVTAIAGEALAAISLSGILIAAGGLLALFTMVRRLGSTNLALLATASLAVNPSYVANAGKIMSEATFAAAWLICMWAIIRTEDARRASTGAFGNALAIVAALVRSAGITLVFAVCVEWLLRRRYRVLLWTIVFSALTVGAWQVWTIFAPDQEARRLYSSDATALADGTTSVTTTIVRRLTGNASAYGSRYVPWELAVPSIEGTRVDNVFWIATITICLIAGTLSLWRRARLWSLSLLSYGALLLIWRWPVERFIQPAIPELLVVIFVGLYVVGSKISRGASQTLPAVFAIAVTWTSLWRDGQVLRAVDECDRQSPYTSPACAAPGPLDFVSVARWVRDHTPPTTVVATPKERAFYYHSGRKTLVHERVLQEDSASFVPYLGANRASYAVLTPAGYNFKQTRHLLATTCRWFDIAYATSPHTILFQLRTEPLPEPGGACAALARSSARISDAAADSAYSR